MIELFTARSGAPSLRAGGRALHSPYDPAGEAERFVEQSAGEAPSTVILLGEGLGYAARCLQARHPGARLVLVYYSREIFDRAEHPAEACWHPGLPLGLADFLRRNVEELDLEGLRVMEWPASSRIFPDISRAANEAVRQVILELNGSFLTTVRAGRLWIRNTIANYLSLGTSLAGKPCAENRPVLVAASGPSLEEAIALISRVRGQVDLWALPSSCRALAAAGLRPDLVVMTDPGFYAMQHLRFAEVSCPLAMPLSAARGSWDLAVRQAGKTGVPLFLLDQPDFMGTPLLRSMGVAAPVILSHGTVAATAIDLARAFTRAPVIVAGLDMCSRDLASHARPGEFEQLLHAAATRLSPHASLAFSRAESQKMEKTPTGDGARVSPSLRTYAGWFSGRPEAGAAKVWRLLPSRVPLDGMETLDAAALRELLTSSGATAHGTQLVPAAIPGRRQRLDVLTGLLEGWRGELSAARAALSRTRGLSPLGELPTVLSLAYHVEPRLLIETRRAARQGNLDGALDHASRMLAGCMSFLESLEGKAAHAG
jgi:hypothetical protein